MYDIRKIVEKANPPAECKDDLVKTSLEIYKKIRTTPKYSATAKAEAAVYLAFEKMDIAISRDAIKPKFATLVYARKQTGMLHTPTAIERVDSICHILDIDDINSISERAKQILDRYREEFRDDYANNTPSITAASAISLASILERKPIEDSEFRKHLGYARHIISRKSGELAKKLGYNI